MTDDIFAFYCAGLAPATRKLILGENYAAKLKSDATPAVAAPTKGGKKDKGEPAAVVTSQVNPFVSPNALVYDPDGLGPVTLPVVMTQALGPFVINPRVGVVLPGQSVAIDAEFTPSGCRTFKESLKIIVSGMKYCAKYN